MRKLVNTSIDLSTSDFTGKALVTQNDRKIILRILVAATKSLTPGNTKGGSITVPLTSSLTGLDYPVLQINTKIVSSHTADSKPVKQEVNGTVTLPP